MLIPVLNQGSGDDGGEEKGSTWNRENSSSRAYIIIILGPSKIDDSVKYLIIAS